MGLIGERPEVGIDEGINSFTSTVSKGRMSKSRKPPIRVSFVMP
jgi:hypothetical protein